MFSNCYFTLKGRTGWNSRKGSLCCVPIGKEDDAMFLDSVKVSNI